MNSSRPVIKQLSIEQTLGESDMWLHKINGDCLGKSGQRRSHLDRGWLSFVRDRLQRMETDVFENILGRIN